MENSVNALQMAAGLLMGILLLSALVYVFNTISNSENTKKDLEVAQETAEFNKKFLAFDKSSMYGTDFISVLSLAISNNQICNAQKSANPDGAYDKDIDGSINIKFNLKTDLSNKLITRYEIQNRNEQGIIEWIEDTEKSEENSSKVLLAKGDYELNGGCIKELTDIATKGNNTNIIYTPNGMRNGYRCRKVIETDNSGFNQLKQRIFECTNVEYNDVGRIYSMSFIEKKISE